MRAQGSAEAVRDTAEQLSTDAVAVKVTSLGVGPVTTADVANAQATGARIVAFNVDFESQALARRTKQAGVQVLCQPVIYRLIEARPLLLPRSPLSSMHAVPLSLACILATVTVLVIGDVPLSSHC